MTLTAAHADLPCPLSEPALQVSLAMALLWTYRPRSAAYGLLPLLGLKRPDGKNFTQEDIKTAQRELRDHGMLNDQPGRDGYYRLRDELRIPLYRRLLDEIPAPTLLAALQRLDAFRPDQARYRWPLYDRAATVSLLRLMVFTGTPIAEFSRLAGLIEQNLMDWETILDTAIFEGFDGPTFERIGPELQAQLLYNAAVHLNQFWKPDLLPACEWALGKLDRQPDALPPHLRLGLADLLLQRGDAARVNRALDGLDGGAVDAMRACLLVQQGRFAEAQADFEAAVKRRQTEVSARKRVFPASMTWYYPLALIAQQTPKHLELARKFCIGEAGKREPHPYDPWGSWVHAASVRLGDATLDKGAFLPELGNHAWLSSLWRILLAAWLGPEALGIRPNDRKLAEFVEAMRTHLLACRLDWLAAQAGAAWDILRGKEPPAGFFVAARSEQWRDVLAALQALGGEGAESAGAGEAARIVWSIRIGKHGALEEIVALEQKRGPRGWSKAKPLSLAKIAGNERLAPWDAKVARAVRQDRAYARRYTLDRAAGIMALIGHPAVVLADAPGQVVDLVEGTPELEVVRESGHYRMRITPAPRPDKQSDDRYYLDDDERREEEALRLITLIQDTPQRVRVIRLSAAQKRAAQLVSGRLEVPASAQNELEQAVHALARHFQVHADSAQGAREIPAESLLRAELSPAGEHLLLRLVAAPLGPDGPRLPPATGRTRLMASIGDETVGTRRDLNAERVHLDAVLDALPFLEDPEIQGGCEWLMEDPEQALAMVESLSGLPDVAAVDWPKGKSVRVVTVDRSQVGLTVKSERDWFRVGGNAALDEGLVLDFNALLDAARSRSRFIPMGNGVYAALTRTLKEQLADLAAVVESGKDGARIPRLAAAWLDEAMEGMSAKTDAEFHAGIERLRVAQGETPALPKSLQAELRPYQEDGFQWAMRLASAGLGGCLADDMGLGKTVQALGVMLARASGGATLVIAPTSLCGNWQAEAQRFAPGLNVQIYGEGDRENQVVGAGAADVVIVSYTLLQQSQERFAARAWHTVVADEAQAIKNAGAKRSLAVFELNADFRLALSGTPVENRLAELWSIMRFANPGLLSTLPHFNQRFAAPIERNRDRDAQHLLRRLIAPFVLRRTKAEVLPELPPRTELILGIAPEAAEAAHYEALRRQAVAEADRALATGTAGEAHLNILAQLTRLRRAACDPRLVTPESPAPGAKVQAFAELAAELVANGHKALVFSQFVDFLQILRGPLDEAGIRYQYLDGATPAAERTRRVAAFQAGEGDLFLISIKAGGFGLNLTAADYVVITDPWWNPAAEDQAMGRAHRIGQQRPVTVYRLVLKSSIEERIVELHHDKRALAESVLSGDETAALPSADDLIALMRGVGPG
ncbi:MAG: DEAD/DEAH box helicase [Sulfuricella sp.]|nr:DEAD/DEAH box helicase [Sulfuricella sp.]